MLKLYDVVFGQNEFEKTKIEVRFEIIETLLITLSISSLEDFEYLESCLYKIKDQLRVKSSNLNKVIKDSQKSLTKKKVLQVIDHLMRLRNKFLQNAFSSLDQPIKLEHNDHLDSKQEELQQPEQITPKEEQVQIVKEQITINPLLFENDLYSIVLTTTASPYVKVTFKKYIDFVLLKNISSLLFDEIQAHGSTIIIEGQKAMVIPRYVNDTILEPLSQDKGIDTDIAYEKLSALIQKSSQKQKDSTQNSYKEFDDSNIKRTSTQKEQEDSLDSLLSSIEKKNPDPTPKPKPKQDTSSIKIEKADPIEIDSKPPKIFNDEIKIIESEATEKENGDKKTPNDPVNKTVNNSRQSSLSKYTIYQDDQLLVTLKQNSKVFGELVINHTSGKTYEQLEEQELTYITIFSKIFSSVLFETLQAHGTNIYWSTKGTSLHIVPRFQNDEINFQWKTQEHGDEFLEQIKGKLLSIMSNTIGSQEQHIQNKPPQKGKESQQDSNNSSDDLKKKAKYVLDELRKIP